MNQKLIQEQPYFSQNPQESHQEVNFPFPKERKCKSSPEKRRVWTYDENVLYARFLKLYTKKFSVNDGDKKFRKYKRMSVFMVTKTPKQCRTHHQKMMIKYETVESIIEHLSSQKTEEKEIQKTENHQESPKSLRNISIQGSQNGQESQKNEKSIPSYSSEFIFDILF